MIKSIQNNTYHDVERLCVADGLWAHQKLASSDLRILSFIICPERIYSNEALELVEGFMNKAQNVYVVSERLLSKISERDGPDGLVSIVQLPCYEIDCLRLRKNAFIMVLDGLENPGNIGTILRTCDGAAVDAVFVCNRRARITSSKLIKASMGAAFTIPIIEFEDMDECIDWLLAHGFNVYLADTRADKTYKEFGYEGHTALVMGSERYGISEKWYLLNPQRLAIPMLGICDSLNVGVAASVIAYEISMQRLKRERGC